MDGRPVFGRLGWNPTFQQGMTRWEDRGVEDGWKEESTEGGELPGGSEPTARADKRANRGWETRLRQSWEVSLDVL